MAALGVKNPGVAITLEYMNGCVKRTLPSERIGCLDSKCGYPGRFAGGR